MKLRIMLLVGALATAACSPTSSPAEKASDAGAVAGAAQKRFALPDCNEVETQDAGADGWIHPDCRLMLADDSMLAIEARFTTAEDESTLVSVQVVAPGDATLQTIEETMGNTFNPVKLEDVDQDGRQDIWLPLETGNVNTNWAVWRQTAGQRFVRLGEVSGVDMSHTGDGQLAVPARGGANMWGVSFYKLGGDAFEHQATVEVIAEATDAGEITGWTCKALPDDLAPGLTLAAAEKKFCAEPAAAGIFE